MIQPMQNCFGKFESVETLRRLALGLNRATLKSLKQRQEAELENGAWEETQKEISQGWPGKLPTLTSMPALWQRDLAYVKRRRSVSLMTARVVD